MVTYILTKVGADWLIFGDIKCKLSRFQQFFQIQGQITPMFWFDLFHNRPHRRPYGQVYYG